jgi:hypothetical protein
MGKDIQILLRERGQVVMFFLLPMVLILVFSAAFAAGQERDELIAVPVVNLDTGGPTSEVLLDSLSQDRGIQDVDHDQTMARTDLEEGFERERQNAGLSSRCLNAGLDHVRGGLCSVPDTPGTVATYPAAANPGTRPGLDLVGHDARRSAPHQQAG